MIQYKFGGDEIQNDLLQVFRGNIKTKTKEKLINKIDKFSVL